MLQICKTYKCTGCGMCSNICPHHAITMSENEFGFIYPVIGDNCIRCGLCIRKCPANNIIKKNKEKQSVFASWTNDKNSRRNSTSGGVFSELAKCIIQQGGVVVGVQWSEDFSPKHVVIEREYEIDKLKGSKYAQSDTNNIYSKVKRLLIDGRKVLFSGTPCQIAALKSFLGFEYSNLYTVDLVCHGVPSSKMLLKHYSEIHDEKVTNVYLRFKDPYWDYTYVRIEYIDGYKYQKLTINDDFFNLFNIGYSLRKSCHNCKYTSTNRVSDITLADFWGYMPKSFKALSYNNGTSCVIINSENGKALFELIKENVYYEKSSIDAAVKGNKCLSEPFKIDEKKLCEYWKDIKNGYSIHELNQKYAVNTFRLPKYLWLRRIYRKYKWIIKR
nr:Coenzyme F420 hydrogenase/dehydrogenase, beta subunit C-terminal domain [uncultured Blautia sp.]